MAGIDLGDTDEAPTKYFTVEEANGTLPYVRRIIGDLMDEYAHWRDGIFKYEVLSADAKADEGESDEQVALRDDVETIAQRINTVIEELTQVGCIFKGFDDGLVDFRSTLDGRDVYLCWKFGEPEIQFWHELDSGFASRQALAEQLVDGGST
jgi:hypothetical protein